MQLPAHECSGPQCLHRSLPQLLHNEANEPHQLQQHVCHCAHTPHRRAPHAAHGWWLQMPWHVMHAGTSCTGIVTVCKPSRSVWSVQVRRTSTTAEAVIARRSRSVYFSFYVSGGTRCLTSIVIHLNKYIRYTCAS